MDDKQKKYDCILNAITTVDSKHLFLLTHKETNGKIEIYVDQPPTVIIKRMKEIIQGKRDKLYLTRGKRNIYISYIGNDKWKLFYRLDEIYKFEYNGGFPMDNKQSVECGEWQYSPQENIAICSECRYEHYLGTYHQYATNYCPNCGQKMKPIN